MRVLIIGIDGADPDLFQRWKQDLPHLRRLADQGAFGPLKSTLPPLTVPAWYVFATGKQPGNLGIFGFARPVPHSYQFVPANLASCSSPALWDLLSAAGQRVGVFNMPGVFPPQPVNGFLVSSSLDTPPNDGRLIFTYPPELSRQLDRLVGGYELASSTHVERANEDTMIRERHRVHHKHAEALLHLASREVWDVLIAVFDITDRIGHQMWKHHDPSHPQHDPLRSPTYADAIKEAYKAVDYEVGRLSALAGEDALIVVMSDHGFGPQHKTFRLNEWLRQRGYLCIDPAYTTIKRSWFHRLGKFVVGLNEQKKWFRRITKPLRGSTLARHLRSRQARLEPAIPLSSVEVDWTRTIAYSFNHHAIRINLKGREPLGIVEPGEHYDTVVKDIITELRSLRDPWTGEPAASRLLKREDAYEGTFLAEAPDLLVFMDGIRTPITPDLAADGPFDLIPLGTGHHRPHGILLVSGSGIRPGPITTASLADLLPTILHVLDLPIPADLDGTVLTDLFEPTSSYALRQARYVQAKTKAVSDFVYSDAEEKAINEHLRGLGYF
jgi:predicted AlkP superfamily phosphohydrolase/phosphomutase